MIKKILIVLAVILVAFVILISSRPSEFQVTRSIAINSDRYDAFKYVNSQLKWEKWSPWANLDPKAKKFFGAPKSGVGSIYKWSGNDEVGAGTSTIIESKVGEFVKFRLEFDRPIKATYISEFYFLDQKGETLVSWNMYGKRSFLGKLLSFFIDCEKMTGEDFDKGLKKLKSVVERESGY